MDIQEILVKFAEFLNQNPSIVIAGFVLSLLANVIQVSTFLTERRNKNFEKAERERLTRLVDTYESVLKIAKETVEDKDKIEGLKSEIQQKTSTATELSSRIQSLQKTAQKEIISQAIGYNLDLIENAYSEVQRLREQHNNLGDLPDLPKESQEVIRNEISVVIQKPYTFPREFLFTSALLIIFLMLLPWPVDSLLLPFLLKQFLITFFEAVQLFPNENIKAAVFRFHKPLIFFASFGVWLNFLNVLLSFVSPLFNGLIASLMSTTNIPIGLLNGLSIINTSLPTFLAFFIALNDWRILLKEIIQKGYIKPRE
ncbi:MAG: hypothetical protein JNK81_10930 [Anaerolineales bacterium]|nr:hypothetical protein [Anaerolineales bacterium]